MKSPEIDVGIDSWWDPEALWQKAAQNMNKLVLFLKIYQ